MKRFADLWKRASFWWIPEETVLTFDVEGLDGLDRYHGKGSGEHVTQLLRRALQEAAHPVTQIDCVGRGQYAILPAAGDSDDTAKLIQCVRERLSALLFDAGYTCVLAVDRTPSSSGLRF